MAETLAIKEGTPSRLPVQFRYQKDPMYARFQNEGIVPDLSASGLCWIACIDMALSPYAPAELDRLDLLMKLGKKMKEVNTLDERGRFHTQHADSLRDSLQELVSVAGIPVDVSVLERQSPPEMAQVVWDGGILIWTLDNPEGGHALVLDKLLVDAGQEEGVFAYWNPAYENPLQAREYVNLQFLTWVHNNTPTKIGEVALAFNPQVPPKATPL